MEARGPESAPPEDEDTNPAYGAARLVEEVAEAQAILRACTVVVTEAAGAQRRVLGHSYFALR